MDVKWSEIHSMTIGGLEGWTGATEATPSYHKEVIFILESILPNIYLLYSFQFCYLGSFSQIQEGNFLTLNRIGVIRLCPRRPSTLIQLQERPLVLADVYSAALFSLRELTRIIGVEARSDSVTGNTAAPCIMGNLLMCIKLRADGATRQPGNTLGSYVFSTSHCDHPIVHYSHRSLRLNVIETAGTLPHYHCSDDQDTRSLAILGIDLFSRMVAFSEMLHRVALVRTDVSEELSTSIIRVTRIGELWTTLS
jgi:hypothetical protein